MLSESKGENKRSNKITTLEKAQHFLLEWKIVQIYDFLGRIVNCFSVQNWTKGMMFVELYMIKESQFPCDVFVTNKSFFFFF